MYNNSLPVSFTLGHIVVTVWIRFRRDPVSRDIVSIKSNVKLKYCILIVLYFFEPVIHINILISVIYMSYRFCRDLVAADLVAVMCLVFNF